MTRVDVPDHAEDLRIANARLKALVNIGLEIASERDAEQLLHKVCVAARDLFGATYVTLGIINQADHTVHLAVSCGLGPAGAVTAAPGIAIGDTLPGLLGTVVSQRRTVRGHSGTHQHPRQLFPSHHPEVQAYLAAPITSPTHVYGWMCIVGNEGRDFTEGDEDLLRALLGQVGLTYELHSEILEPTRAEEEARRASEARYRTLFEYAPDGIVIANGERYIDANASMCRMLGYSRNELIGLLASDIVTPAEARHIGSALRSISAGSGYHREWQFRRKDGSVFLADVIATTMPDGNLLGMIRDSTERNQAIDALRNAEERTRYALEAAGIGIWDTDYITGVSRMSEILEAHYGLAPGAYDGTSHGFLALIHPDDRAAVHETLGKAMSTGADFSEQHRAIWPDGTVRWLRNTGRILLGEHGEPVRGVGITQDITEGRAMEEQFQQAQKMEAIGRLAGGVAHDFNNLLTVILGFCELSLADIPQADPHHADIMEIQKAGQQAVGLTRQLLAFSRKQIIEPTVLNLNAVAKDMRVMLGRLIGEDITIALNLGTGLCSVRADRGQVEQIVMNLAVNARDAMVDGGTLTIATANVHLDVQYAKTHHGVTPGPHVMLAVTDTGTGMTPQVQARLFEPFFTTKELGKGTGLGLATVQSIVARSGGSVAVHSEVGQGASFQVYFPKADVAAVIVDAPPPVPRSRPATETVLVVDDAQGVLELARKLLQRQGYTVVLASNADEALGQFDRDASIEVLLTDVVMPGASGPELSRQLLERRPALKVIYMSGYTEEAIARHGILMPGITFLHKPFTSETLGRKIREVLDR